MINIKQMLIDRFKRDSKGKFQSPKVAILKGIWLLVGVMAVVYALELEVIKVVLYWRTRELQKPIVIMVGESAKQYNDTIFSVITRPFIRELPPLKVLRPVSAYHEVDVVDELNPVERKIYNRFGEKNYRVFRALAQCESGMRGDAVNWSTHDIGLMQINWPTWEDAVLEKFGYTLADMFDVDKNLEVAYWIFDRDGDGVGSIEPWVATRTVCFSREITK